VRRELADGFELDDDPARVDVAAVHRFISEASYWAPGRPYELMERLVREATRVVGLYRGADQVGFCRAVSCFGMPYVYLADVYVLPAWRGGGLGTELVREMVEGGALRDEPWILHTADAHGLYERFGFTRPGIRTLVRAPGGSGPSIFTETAEEPSRQRDGTH
jgi:GNAT superfamily N-acetyltransferase